MNTDEELSLKQRLALDDRIVRLLEKKVRLFLKALPNETLESAQHQYENLMVQLMNYQTNLERQFPLQAANDKEIAEYQYTNEETVKMEAKAKEDIISLKEELIEAQKIRDHKLEYDRVAREIMKLKKRETYTNSIETLQRDIDLLEKEKARKNIALEKRKQDLSTLVNSIKDLQKSVDEERSNMDDDQKKVIDMERGYISSDDEGDIASSDEEDTKEEEKQPAAFSRFQERDNGDDEEEEEGIVEDTPMVEAGAA
ncbi:hypothetical protein K501DRAFT_325283 [Backusella circina FSU 941]|nr:hypothetical protein K501DRAFT_325283 [Backusella circina FSU 941]